jgi:NAD(P)-dependent dehydrogenase (short-subunit alcohol dehydrogenase family)
MAGSAMGGDMMGLYELGGRVAVITGGAGVLGRMHALAIAGAGGTPVLADIAADRARAVAAELGVQTGRTVGAVRMDVTDPESVRVAADEVEARHGPVSILINNAANDPKVAGPGQERLTRFEHFPMDQWQADFAVGLTGAFLCCQVLGTRMAERGAGVILNIASDLGLIAPDQRLYWRDDVPADRQSAKPVSYSVVKHGLVGLTRYLATYWAEAGVRVNALAPGGVLAGQSPEFLDRVQSRIPMARLARPDEYQGAVVFLCSDASSYVTGAVLVADGGRTVW